MFDFARHLPDPADPYPGEDLPSEARCRAAARAYLRTNPDASYVDVEDAVADFIEEDAEATTGWRLVSDAAVDGAYDLARDAAHHVYSTFDPEA